MSLRIIMIALAWTWVGTPVFAQAIPAPSEGVMPPQLERIPWEEDAVPIHLVKAFDVNNDGLMDLVYQRRVRHLIRGSVLEQTLNEDLLIRTVNGDTTFTTIAELDTFGELIQEITPIDFNADGLLDLLTEDTVHFQSASGWTSQRLEELLVYPYEDLSGPYVLNDDSYPDFLVNTSEGEVVLYGDGVGFGEAQAMVLPEPEGNGSPVVSVSRGGVFDFDRDGFDDVEIVADFEDGQTGRYVFFGGGDPEFFTSPVQIESPFDLDAMFVFWPDDPAFEPRCFFGLGARWGWPPMEELVLPLSRTGAPQIVPLTFSFPDHQELYADVDHDGNLDQIHDSRTYFDFFKNDESDAVYGPQMRAGVYPDNTLADVNGDGYLDLVGYFGAIQATLNPGERPTFGRRRAGRIYPTQARSFMMISDIDGDSRADILGGGILVNPLAGGEWDETHLLYTQNAMNMDRALHPAHAEPVVVLCNTAGGVDLAMAVVDQIDSVVHSVIEQRVTVASPPDGPDGPVYSTATLAVADLDGDGFDEIIARDISEQTDRFGLGVWTPDGDGYRVLQWIEGAVGSRCVSGDFDDDGDIDIATGGMSAVYFYMNDGTGRLVPDGVVATPAANAWLHAVDLNGDGRTDLVGGGLNVAGSTNIAAYAWVQVEGLPVSGGQIKVLGDPMGVDPWEIYSADLNRDAVEDLVFIGHGLTGTSGFWIMTSPLDDEKRTVWYLHDLPVNYPLGAVGDLDGDGLTDIVYVAGNRGMHLNYSMGYPAGACLADVNGDSILDLGDIQVFVQMFLGGDIAADINGDGLLDLGDIQGFVTAYLEGC